MGRTIPCLLLLLTAPAVRLPAAETLVPIPIRPLPSAEGARLSYTRDIRPLLVDKCLECHGSEKPKGGFRVTSVQDLKQAGEESGPGVVPGEPDDSAIIQYIRGLKTPQMPKKGPVLTPDELHRLRSWIAAGAKDDTNSMSTQSGEPTSLTVKTGKISKTPINPQAAERLIQRRQNRLATLPAPAPPPVVPGIEHPIDRFLAAAWARAGLPEARQPPPLCSDEIFLRRVYLDITGVIPTVLEARAFHTDTAPDKRARQIDALLSREEDYADHWTPFWEEAIGSQDFNTQGGMLTRGNYRKWLGESFRSNKPYDLMVAELIDPTLPGAKPPEEQEVLDQVFQIRYVRNRNHEEVLKTASDVGQVFLGTGMKCASCHSHFENREWPQTRFLAFAGLFSPHDLELIRCEVRTGEIIPARFPFELAGLPEQAPADPIQRLQLAASALVDPANPRFAKAFINRLWKRYFGLGLVEPVDDFRADRPASHPELLDWLADDFMRHGFDIRHAMRRILTSHAYQRAYQASLADPTEPDAVRHFRSPQLRRLSAEQLLDSLWIAGWQRIETHQRLFRSQRATPLTRSLGRPASRNEITTQRPDQLAVVQSLELLNGEQWHRRVYTSPFLDVLAGGQTATQMVESLYNAALNRFPTPEESERAVTYLRGYTFSLEERDPQPVEVTWLDDELPEAARPSKIDDRETWKWVSRKEGPVFSGDRSHTVDAELDTDQHSINTLASPPLLRLYDTLVTYVHPDPAHPPERVMIQWRQGDHVSQVWWGETPPPEPATDFVNRFHAGPLPSPGTWTRLEMPAAGIGLKTGDLAGWAYTVQGGRAWWDRTGIVQAPRHPATGPLGDVLWALVTSPEFQYLR